MSDTVSEGESSVPASDGPTRPPVAARHEVVHELHGDRRVDAYNWMRDTDDPETLAYLAAERAYYDASTASLGADAAALFAAMEARVAPAEASVAHRRDRYAYFTRTLPAAEYPQHCRIPLPDGAGDGDWRAGVDLSTEPQVILDPAELTDESGYLDIGLTLVSPDERLLAYSFDRTGDEVYRMRIRDLDTGRDLADELPRTYYTAGWSADSSTLFYTVHDAIYRPHQVWRHRVGTPADDDVMVFEELDERYGVEIEPSRSGDVIAIGTYCRDTTEVWLVDAHAPDQPPRCVEPRRKGVEYFVEHARTPAGDRLFIVTNDGAEEYRLVSAPADDPSAANWSDAVPALSGERLYSAHAFDGHLVLSLRRDVRLTLRAHRLEDDGSISAHGVEIAAQVDNGAVRLADNEQYDTATVTVYEDSYTTLRAWYDVELGTGDRHLIHQTSAPAYDASDYVSELVWAPSPSRGQATDAAPVEVPVTVVRRADVPLDGTAPCLLYGYGAYEACDEPQFDPGIIALLDRGVVFAHAHIRGGGEGGRRWWLDGMMARKQNTFTDHVAAADRLADGLVDGDRIVSRGLSAGGLLQGAVFSQAPDRWRGVIAEVAFVDVVTTMLDASIPLTVNEWDEWGDPSRPDDYAWMLAYSPYDNPPPAGGRPDLLVTGALHDPRVMVFEPAKWVALLRHTDPQWSPRCLFRVELGAGAHVGPSGRYAHLRYEADVYAWLLARVAT
ncbi:MAG TPA: prolyl oligopeptidase family serine peptidase [Nocardioidaceae bacterium]|nr:prolyl oligopeptidase family serine peptidase [Nocardioidaceae bacterium]